MYIRVRRHSHRMSRDFLRNCTSIQDMLCCCISSILSLTMAYSLLSNLRLWTRQVKQCPARDVLPEGGSCICCSRKDISGGRTGWTPAGHGCSWPRPRHTCGQAGVSTSRGTGRQLSARQEAQVGNCQHVTRHQSATVSTSHNSETVKAVMSADLLQLYQELP